MLMARLKTSIFLIWIMLLLTACSSEWQQHYDLGMKYLSDGNYEEAIIEFEAAIEIDDMRSDTYIGLAEVYIEQGDLQKAIEILEKGYEKTKADAISAKLDEIKSGAVYDMQGRQRMMTHYDAEGKLDWYHVYDYEGDKQSKATRYNAAGKAQESIDIKYDKDGNEIQTYENDSDTGELAKVSIIYKNGKKDKQVAEYISSGAKRVINYIYDSKERVSKEIEKYSSEEDAFTVENRLSYDSAGNVISRTSYINGSKSYSNEYEYDKNGNCVKHVFYLFEDGKKKADRYTIYKNDDNGELIAEYTYDADGNLTGSTKY